MRRRSFSVIIAVCLSALIATSITGCFSSNTSSGGQNGGGGQNRGNGGMMNNGGSNSNGGHNGSGGTTRP